MTQTLPHDPRGYFARVPRIIDVLLVFCLGLFVNAYHISNGPLAGTEGHRALTAHQMVTTNQWLIPKLYDQYYLRKPPLHYWILGALEKVTGRADTFVWRIPSAVAAAIMAVFFCVITGRWFGRLAGLCAGISSCGMVALWGQGRTAELDALNSLACAACACWLIDLGYGRPRHPIVITVCAGLAFGAAMMTKGPAGIAVIAGALIGPAVFNRDLTPLKRSGWWIALLIGTTLFGIYCLAVWARFRSMNEVPDTSGLAEVSYNFLEERLKNLLDIILLPFTMLLYMLPMSLSFLLVFRRDVWNATQSGPAEGWSDDDCRLLRALTGTLVISCALTMLIGLAHARYSYIWAPMMCPIVGAMAAAWQRNVFSPSIKERIPLLLCISLITFAVGCGGITTVYYLHEHGSARLPLAVAISAAALTILAVVNLSRGRYAFAGCSIVILIAFAAVPYADLGAPNRRNHSTFVSAQSLRQRLPQGTTVITGNLLMDQPELFYYSGMNVKSYGNDKFLVNFDLPASGWIVLSDSKDDPEFARNKNDPRMTNPVRLSSTGPAVVLAWYDADKKLR